jgi:hypothetical protein
MYLSIPADGVLRGFGGVPVMPCLESREWRAPPGVAKDAAIPTKCRREIAVAVARKMALLMITGYRLMPDGKDIRERHE